MVVLEVTGDESRLGRPVLTEWTLMQGNVQMHLGDVTRRLTHVLQTETTSELKPIRLDKEMVKEGTQ